MNALELSCLAIAGLYVAIRARRDASPARFLLRLGLLSLAAWIGEDTVIRAYGFYAYADVWTLWLDVTPVMIPLIWPVVIHSAWDLACHLLGERHRLAPLVAAGFVLADAAFIEPIALQAGLWRWTEPGLFAVPPIGILGWALFAVLALSLLHRARDASVRPLTAVGVLILAPLGCHLLLLALWWGALRWVNASVPPWPAVSVVALVGLAMCFAAMRGRLRCRVPLVEMLARVPAAGFFVVLLGLQAAPPLALIAWAACFVPPYLALVNLDGLTRAAPQEIC
jgi:hypothetical protein